MKYIWKNIHTGLFIIALLGLFFVIHKANALSTSAIELGANPIISSNCSSSYTVPIGKVLVITDLVAYGTSSSYYGSASILTDGVSLIQTGGLYVNNPATVASFQTGFVSAENTVISCSTSYASLSWSGYLAHP